MRIASLNLCADQLLLDLVEPERIAALTFRAADPRLSTMAEAARDVRVIQGRTEEVLALAPDLVVTGPFNARSLTEALARHRVRLFELQVPEDFAALDQELRRLGAALGEAARAAALADSIAARLARLAPLPAGARPRAVLMQANGFNPGRGTFADDVLTRAGFDNLARSAGIEGWGVLGLERLVTAEPQALIIDRDDRRGAALAYEVLAHPALKAMRVPPRQIALPERLWVCATPASVAAVELLAEAAGAMVAPAMVAPAMVAPAMVAPVMVAPVMVAP
jgi:iron complex transport system substrate-binding protein